MILSRLAQDFLVYDVGDTALKWYITETEVVAKLFSLALQRGCEWEGEG